MMKIFCFVVLICGLVNQSGAWGEEGHKIIAQIASDMLTETASGIVAQFLGEASMPDVAPFPDFYDHTAAGNWSEPCHFCNLPKGATNFTMEYCPHFCVVRSIFNYTSILQGEQSNPFECDVDDDDAEPCALIFLIHFVGDVHQPLHVGYGYDEGGNLVPVKFYGESTVLHHVWDDNIIIKWNSNFTDAALELETMMSNEPALVKYYISITNAIDWADESFHFVRSTCYNYTDQNLNVTEEFWGGEKAHYNNKIHVNGGERTISIYEDEPDLTDKYYETNLPIIKQRLIAAGVRLGTLLNNILTG